MLHILKFYPKYKQRRSKESQLLPGEAQVWKKRMTRETRGVQAEAAWNRRLRWWSCLCFFHECLADYLCVSQRATITTELGFLDLSFEIEACQKRFVVFMFFYGFLVPLCSCFSKTTHGHTENKIQPYGYMKKIKKQQTERKGWTVRCVASYSSLSLCSGASYPITGSPSCTCLLI